MFSSTLTCHVHESWESRLAEPIADVGSLYLPSGVFYCREGTGYYPSTVATQQEYLSESISVGLNNVAALIQKPTELLIGGAGSQIVTNTGARPLVVGQTFTLEYPTQADRLAQRAATKMTLTRQTHPQLAESTPLWGNFLATVARPFPPNNSLAYDRFSEEIADTVNGGSLLMLGRVQSLCRAMLVNGNECEPLRFYEHVTGVVPAYNQDLARQNLRAGLAGLRPTIDAMSGFVDCYRPRVIGTVQHAVLGNSEVIPTGSQCFAFINIK